jgi:hypothetical protein
VSYRPEKHHEQAIRDSELPVDPPDNTEPKGAPYGRCAKCGTAMVAQECGDTCPSKCNGVTNICPPPYCPNPKCGGTEVALLTAQTPYEKGKAAAEAGLDMGSFSLHYNCSEIDQWLAGYWAARAELARERAEGERCNIL